MITYYYKFNCMDAKKFKEIINQFSGIDRKFKYYKIKNITGNNCIVREIDTIDDKLFESIKKKYNGSKIRTYVKNRYRGIIYEKHTDKKVFYTETNKIILSGKDYVLIEEDINYFNDDNIIPVLKTYPISETVSEIILEITNFLQVSINNKSKVIIFTFNTKNIKSEKDMNDLFKFLNINNL